jgi:tRNA modification GTPase
MFVPASSDTIIALATPPGVGAIAVLRLSGPAAISLTNQVFHSPGQRPKDLTQQPSHTIHFGSLYDGAEVLDEVLVSLFVAPRSFTKENVVEISCHGSPYIIRRAVQLFLGLGARLARAGEFTQRAFLHGAFDLAQAEAVADLIAADSEAAHHAALHQMRGGFSQQIKDLRQQLVHFASLIELELDFGEEDVEFANRQDLKDLVAELQRVIGGLVRSFELGQVLKNGVPVVIAGKPNAGKSTLLNALLNEDKAIVSDIPGTTRDFIEDEINLDGIVFRFIDTAGLRDTQDQIEALGVERTKAKMQAASLILYLFDLQTATPTDLAVETSYLQQLGRPYLLVGNKLDLVGPGHVAALGLSDHPQFLAISAGHHQHLEALKQRLLATVTAQDFRTGSTIVTSLRHFEALQLTREALDRVMAGLGTNLTGDFLAMDIRQALHHLGSITGEISTDDLLANIFSKFCIGK